MDYYRMLDVIYPSMAAAGVNIIIIMGSRYIGMRRYLVFAIYCNGLQCIRWCR